MGIYRSWRAVRKAHLCCLDPDTSVRWLEVNGTSVPYKGFKIIFISEALFLNCSVASSTHRFFNNKKHSPDGIKFIIISNKKIFITVLWVKCCLHIYWRDSLLWGSGLSSGWGFFVQGPQFVLTGFSLHVLYCLHLFSWDWSEECSPEICSSWSLF